MSTDLFGDPLPEPLPSNSRLNDESELAGHEIRAVFLETRGIHGRAEMVIVTATGCWIAFGIEGCDLDDAYITVRHAPYSMRNDNAGLAAFVPASVLLNHNCINTAEYDRLKALEAEHEETARQREANHLRQRLAALEGQKP